MYITVIRKWSAKKLEIKQILQENTSAVVYFLIKLQAFIVKDTPT